MFIQDLPFFPHHQNSLNTLKEAAQTCTRNKSVNLFSLPILQWDEQTPEVAKSRAFSNVSEKKQCNVLWFVFVSQKDTDNLAINE